MTILKNSRKNCTHHRLASFSLLLFVVFLFNTGALQAQLPKGLPAVKTGTVNAGSLLTQFMNAIKPLSFTDQWAGEKSNWLASAGKIASAPGLIEGVTSLTKFIKPAMFKEAFKPANLLQTATKAKSMMEAASLLKSLEAGLKPEAMVGDWATKEGAWTSALDMLQ